MVHSTTPHTTFRTRHGGSPAAVPRRPSAADVVFERERPLSPQTHLRNLHDTSCGRIPVIPCTEHHRYYFLQRRPVEQPAPGASGPHGTAEAPTTLRPTFLALAPPGNISIPPLASSSSCGALPKARGDNRSMNFTTTGAATNGSVENLWKLRRAMAGVALPDLHPSLANAKASEDLMKGVIDINKQEGSGRSVKAVFVGGTHGRQRQRSHNEDTQKYQRVEPLGLYGIKSSDITRQHDAMIRQSVLSIAK